jgi:hypothetical protein
MTRYRNPVHPEYFADPFVLRDGQGYVAYGTGRMVAGRASRCSSPKTSSAGVLQEVPWNRWRRSWGPTTGLPRSAVATGRGGCTTPSATATADTTSGWP